MHPVLCLIHFVLEKALLDFFIWSLKTETVQARDSGFQVAWSGTTRVSVTSITDTPYHLKLIQVPGLSA